MKIDKLIAKIKNELLSLVDETETITELTIKIRYEDLSVLDEYTAIKPNIEIVLKKERVV